MCWVHSTSGHATDAGVLYLAPIDLELLEALRTARLRGNAVIRETIIFAAHRRGSWRPGPKDGHPGRKGQASPNDLIAAMHAAGLFEAERRTVGLDVVLVQPSLGKLPPVFEEADLAAVLLVLEDERLIPADERR